MSWLMRFCLIASLWLCIVPCAAPAEIPMPVRSNAALLGAEKIVLCSDFEQINAARLSFFLSELELEVATTIVLDGPAALSKSEKFNVLAVISGAETQESTHECALDTAPYGEGVTGEINTAVERLLSGFEHPNPTISATLGDTLWSSSNYYHETESWITVVIAMRTSSADQLDFTMMRLFDVPEATCKNNLACLSR